MFISTYMSIYLNIMCGSSSVSLAMITADTDKSMHSSPRNYRILHSYALCPYLFLFNILFSYFLARS